MNHFETLEIRQLMSAAITDMTALAQTQTVHSGVTYLYLNFDGGSINDTQAGGTRKISAFVAKSGENRQQEIQSITYQVSEMFAPFNVQVQVMTGAGNYSKTNGNTTIFVGDDAANTTAQGVNGIYSVTPTNSMDYPTPPRGPSHKLNSDTYDMAFVDPVGATSTGTGTVLSDSKIAADIAHEAGHTFGLAHVLTISNGSSTEEMMSYDSVNHFFSNSTFQITDLNYDGTSTTHDSSVVPTLTTGKLTTQNSYTCLMALLGPTTFNSTAYPEHRVADTTLVDPAFSSNTATNAATPSLQTNLITSASIHAGEYDVYNFVHPSFAALPLTINVATRGSLVPQVFVYDSTGSTLVTSFTGTSGTFTPHGTYRIVIGSYNDASTGAYGISFSAAQMPIAATSVVAQTATPTSAALFSTTPISQQVLAN